MNLKNIKAIMLDVIIFLLAILFIYASVSKLIVIEEFRGQLTQSPLVPQSFVLLLSYAIPMAELVLVVLLYIEKTKLLALYLSFSVMIGFTMYLALLLSIDETLPCSCGGILGTLGFVPHLYFNTFFVLLSFVGILIYNKLMNDLKLS